MRAWKAVIALLLTSAILLVSSEISPDRPPPTVVIARTGSVVMTHTAQFAYASDEGSPLFSVRVEGPMSADSFGVFLKYRPAALRDADLSESFIRLEMTLGDQAIDDYEVYLSKYPPGERMEYYIEVTDPRGDVLARLPKAGGPDGEVLPFEFRAIPPTWIVIVRALFRFAALLAATLACLASLGPEFGSSTARFLGKSILWVFTFLLLGGVVFEIWYRRAVFGGLGWGGWPLDGFDFVHTVTEIALLFWIILIVLLKGSAFTVKGTGNLVSATTARVLVSVGYLLMLAIYIIPQK